MFRRLKSLSDSLGVSNSFALANVCAFALSGSLVGLVLATATGLLVWRAGAYAAREGKASSTLQAFENRFFDGLGRLILGRNAKAENVALRINAVGMGLTALATGGITLMAGGFAAALFPVLAGASFAVGNFFGSSERFQAIQTGQRAASGLTKTLTNPAVYYGLGYTNLGLLAGGGLNLFTQPLANLAALTTTTLSVLSTAASVVGLMSKKIKNPAPFMFVAHGTAFNVLSALFTLNPLAVLNNAFACHGEVKLGMLLREPEVPKSTKEYSDIPVVAGTEQTTYLRFPVPGKSPRRTIIASMTFAEVARPTIVDKCFENLSYVACWPVRALDRMARPKVS